MGDCGGHTPNFGMRFFGIYNGFDMSWALFGAYKSKFKEFRALHYSFILHAGSFGQLTIQALHSRSALSLWRLAKACSASG